VPSAACGDGFEDGFEAFKFSTTDANRGTFPNALCLAAPLPTGTKAMQSRKLVMAALLKEIDAVRLSISLLEKELWTAGIPNKVRWRSGYELTAQKARLAKLENVLAHYPSVTRARPLDSNSLSYGQRNQVSLGKQDG
jgi:cell division septal protein FtsQ